MAGAVNVDRNKIRDTRRLLVGDLSNVQRHNSHCRRSCFPDPGRQQLEG